MLLRSGLILFRILFLFLFSYSLSGQDLQKRITQQKLALTNYSADFELSPKWSLSAEIQERIYLDPVRQSQIFVKSQLGFEPFKDFTFTNGLAYGYRFLERISYMLSLECKLLKSKNHDHDLYLKLSDGIYVNTHKGIVYNSFDQNRFYAGLNYKMVKNMTIELGYVNYFQQRISGVDYLNRNIASLAINHSIKMYH